jgi:hypothetical protein
MGSPHGPDHLQEAEADGLERDAFNAAFRELGLRWHWDATLFGSLKSRATDAERVRTYLETREPHLLKAYDASFLVDAVCAAKAEAFRRDAPSSARPGRCADCADYATGQTGF